MGKVRRSRPTRELHKAVPRLGSNAPFSKERRHVAVNKILRGGLSYNAASKQVADLVKANYVDNGSVDARAPAPRSIRRWTAQVVLHGRTSALSPPGRPLRLTAAEDEFVLGWALEMKFFTQVCLPAPAPRPEPCAPLRFPAIDALCTSLPQPTAGKRGRALPFVTSPLKCLTRQDQLAEVVYFSFGKRLKGTAAHDVIVRLGLTRKAVSTIDPRYDENAVAPASPSTLPLPRHMSVLRVSGPLPWSYRVACSSWQVQLYYGYLRNLGITPDMLLCLDVRPLPFPHSSVHRATPGPSPLTPHPSTVRRSAASTRTRLACRCFTATSSGAFAAWGRGSALAPDMRSTVSRRSP